MNEENKLERAKRMGLSPSIPVTNPPPPSPYKKAVGACDYDAIMDAYVGYDSDPRANGPDDFDAFADAVADAVASLNVNTCRQISVEYTCCGAQEYWPLNANGDLELTHAEICQPCAADLDDQEGQP